MKELCQSLPPSGTYAEQHLLESIPEEDQAALLPIIKLAFPILEWGRLQSFCPREVGLSMQTRHGIMQMEYQHRLPLSKEVLFSTDEGSQVDKSLCTSLVSVLPSSMFTGNVTQVSERAAPEESCTMTDGKNLLSLGSPPSEKCLGVDACIKDVLACTSSEYSWLQQQEASLGAAFHCGDHVWKRVSAENTLDLSSCTSRKSSESNELQGGRVIEATNRHGNSKESVTLANNKRKASSTCWQGHDVKSKRVQISCYTMANDVEFSQETEMRCSSPESTVAMRECSDKLAGTHVAGSAILDRMMELHKLERCHRSNGKQWRCSKNASPGTLYCELHHKYRSKCRIKKNVSPGKAGFLEQKRAAFLKEKQVNVARCHRTDGKLWQCAKQAMPGSLYCENHHNRFKKSKKQLSQLRESSLEASKNKPIVVEEGHVSKLKEGNGLDETSVLSSMKRDGLMQLCDIVAEKRELEMSVCGSAGENELEANRQGAFMGRGRNLTQMEDVAGLVSLANGQKEDRAEPVLPQVASPKPKKSVNGLGQFIDGGPISREVPLVVKEGSNSDIRQVGGSGHSDAKPQGTEDGVSLRCHRNDGRQWRCFELSKPGSSYCEQQQIFEPWAKADKITEAEGHSLENLPNKETRSPNEDRGDSNMDSADDCFAGSSCHREQLQEVEQLNNIMSQDVASLKQCQRKDGKGWQCLKDAKAGYNYCPHHLEYLSKRKTRWNKNRSSKPVVNGFSLSDKASPAIPTILNQEESAREFSNKPLDNIDCSLADPGDAYSKHGHAMHIVGAEITPQESSCGSDDLVSSLADPLSAFCKHGHCTHTRKAPTILQESLSVNERIQMQEACTSFSNLIDEINTPQDISEKEIQACVDKNTQQHQHLRLGRSILCSHNQKSCVAHDSSCNEGSFKEEIKSPFDKTSAQHTLDTVGGADVACDKGKILHESNQFNGTFLQEISSLKQCQRKDGKYWQCSKSAKQGQNYCLHHLVYLRNRRYASKSCRKANHQLGSEDRALFTGDGPFLCSTISSSATPSMLQKGLCARKPLLKSGTHLAQDVHSCLADPVDAIWNQNESDCQKQESSTGTIVETENSPQESCSGACIKHEICAGLSNEIDAPQNIQEGTICFDSKN